MKVLIGILLIVAVPLALSEFTDWCPWLAARLARLAARLLSPSDRERYEEEWLGELNAAPGKLTKVVVAVGFFLGAIRMREFKLELHNTGKFGTRGWLTLLLWLICGRDRAFITAHFEEQDVTLWLGIRHAPRNQLLATVWAAHQIVREFTKLMRAVAGLPDPKELLRETIEPLLNKPSRVRVSGEQEPILVLAISMAADFDDGEDPSAPNS
jgi:hypothetical protein